VIHASGTGEGLTSALRLAAFEATVLELSWYGERTVTLPLGEAFHSRRLTLRSSQVGSIAADQRARWTAGRRMELALRLLAEPVLDVLISGESPFGELPQLMARLAESPGDELCHRISYR
jgi:threonine dehydrogenase-like Zn-dependent dehydrogenase